VLGILEDLQCCLQPHLASGLLLRRGRDESTGTVELGLLLKTRASVVLTQGLELGPLLTQGLELGPALLPCRRKPAASARRLPAPDGGAGCAAAG
jgi:hypothetical protein